MAYFRETTTEQNPPFTTFMAVRQRIPLARKRFEEQMADGYKAMAEEHKRFAGLAADMANETVPEWK